MQLNGDKENHEQDRAHACIDYIMVCAVPRPWIELLSQNLKPRKLILRAFSDFPQKLAPPKLPTIILW